MYSSFPWNTFFGSWFICQWRSYKREQNIWCFIYKTFSKYVFLIIIELAEDIKQALMANIYAALTGCTAHSSWHLAKYFNRLSLSLSLSLPLFILYLSPTRTLVYAVWYTCSKREPFQQTAPLCIYIQPPFRPGPKLYRHVEGVNNLYKANYAQIINSLVQTFGSDKEVLAT